MRRLLQEIRIEFQIPVILVTHDVFEAYTMGDQVIVYSSGKVVERGTPAEIFHLPPELEIEKLLTASSSK
jgi:ABC-type sugar transport system ATPase subunit